MERFDEEGALRAVEKYHVTHAQFVPTMFSRMLKLPPDVRGGTAIIPTYQSPKTTLQTTQDSPSNEGEPPPIEDQSPTVDVHFMQLPARSRPGAA
jgi:hypothetical protein